MNAANTIIQLTEKNHQQKTMSALKIAIVICLVAATYAQHGYEHHDDHHDYYAPPHYSYEYKVRDSHTGDIKSAHETREGDVVKGYYTLHDADGTTREVHYTADKHNGFNAEVKKIGHAHQPQHHY